MNATYPACSCCNPLFYHFWLHIMRRKFLQGTANFTAAIIGGGSTPMQVSTNDPSSSGTDAGTSLAKEQENLSLEDRGITDPSDSGATIYVAKNIITIGGMSLLSGYINKVHQE
ncbi:hypothetical protein ACE1CM_13560 [Microseira sp. BLCC-F43]